MTKEFRDNDGLLWTITQTSPILFVISNETTKPFQVTAISMEQAIYEFNNHYQE